MRSDPRRTRRAQRRVAWASTLAAAPPARDLAVDPLDRGASSSASLLVAVPLAVFAAIGAHVVFTGVIWAVGSALGHDTRVERDEPITVAVIEPEPPPPSAPEPEPAPEPAPQPAVAAPKPAPRTPAPPKTSKPPAPPPAAPPSPATPTPPQKIVGVDFGSTVANGSGPVFATGNDLNGQTAPTAHVLTGTPPASEPPRNRVATHMPEAGVELVKPKRLGEVKPSYPATLRAQGVEGNVVVQVRVDTSGAVAEASIIEGTPYAEMNTEALATARKQRFSPATRAGTAVEFTLTYTVRFRLDDQ